MTQRVNDLHFRIKWEAYRHSNGCKTWCWHVYYRFEPHYKWNLQSINNKLEDAIEHCRTYVQYCALGRRIHKEKRRVAP